MAGVGGHGGKDQSGCQYREPEHGDGHALPGGALFQGVADEPGGKREERDGEQEEQVQAQEDPVDVVKILGQAVVGDPSGADRQEADEVDEVGRPVAQELLHGEPGGRSARSSTSSVMAIASTPSLNASILALPRTAPLVGIWSSSATASLGVRATVPALSRSPLRPPA